MPAHTRPRKITFGEMRDFGVHGVLVYCQNYQFSHSIAISADRWSDEIRLSDIERCLPARPAAKEAPTSGRTFIGTSRPSRRWAIASAHGPRRLSAAIGLMIMMMTTRRPAILLSLMLTACSSDPGLPASTYAPYVLPSPPAQNTIVAVAAAEAS
jgi:hypothetical protein